MYAIRSYYAKTDNIMGWFAKYDPAKKKDEAETGEAD